MNKLTPEQERILKKKGTEKPFTGAFWNYHEKGTYTCAQCDQELFASDDKYDSGTGWPSFKKPIHPDAINEKNDNLLWMKRTEVVCSLCGGHLGHVFNDGPPPTGQRYCMNSGAFRFKQKKKITQTFKKE